MSSPDRNSLTHPLSLGHVYRGRSVKLPDQACFWFELQSYSAICTGGSVCLDCATLPCWPGVLLFDFQELGPVADRPPQATQ